MGITPVLVDVGASLAPPKIWEGIAARSVYVGFDPDLREIRELPRGSFKKSHIVNTAVVGAGAPGEVPFHLTRSPLCSSTLPPDTEALSAWLFSDLFEVVSTASVPAAPLETVLARLSLDRVDWLKTDSQGTDLRIFNGLGSGIRAKVLAIDIEPGLIDAYRGEDLFVDAHRGLSRTGFWLSSLDIRGTVRMRRSTLAEFSAAGRPIGEREVYRAVRTTPGWCEARYLRSVESLPRGAESERSLALLWVFALLDDQPGFALDIAAEYARSFGKNDRWECLVEEPLSRIRRAHRRGWISRIARRPLRLLGAS
jgi:FkbM family methyltransferase